MGVGGNFWDLLKPFARPEGFGFLRDKRVAVDLSYWIVQNETAIKGYALNPNIRLTFFRTINLFSKFGAFPVFVVDGSPSPLKSQARLLRFYRGSGVDVSDLPVVEGVSVERNKAFQKCVNECVELLQLLGIPVLKAKGEAEALCAQLNRDGQVDACITADSDAFLFGAKCVIKHLDPNSKDPLECYQMSDIEAGLGLKRKHLIAMALLVGNDHDLDGIKGIGVDKAIRFIKPFSEDEVLDRLVQAGRGENILDPENINSEAGSVSNLDENHKPKMPHCSVCGHPGSKKAHLQSSCEICISVSGEVCMRKPLGFKCNCTPCNLAQEAKEKLKNENWQLKISEKIAAEPNFPNSEIMEMYLRHNNEIDDVHQISWENPKTGMLIDYLAYSQHWEPSYIRKMMLPFMSTLFLRGMASNRAEDALLCEQYEFHSIQRTKIRYGHQLYVVKWKRTSSTMMANVVLTTPPQEPNEQHDLNGANESADLADEPDVPQIYVEDGSWFLLTDEDMKLVQSAYPEKVEEFLKEKELKELMKSKRKKPKPESPRGVQLSIKEFYRASKAVAAVEAGENREKSACSTGSEKSACDTGSKRKETDSDTSKSARRKLEF